MTGAKIAEYIKTLLDTEHSTVAKAEVMEKLPFLEETEVVRILREHAPEIGDTEVGGIPCWRDVAAGLPDDFSAKATELADFIEQLDMPLTAENLRFALCVEYRRDFAKECGWTDNTRFIRLLQAKCGQEQFLTRLPICHPQKYAFVSVKKDSENDDFARKANGDLIIGLSGKPLVASSWRAAVATWKNPRNQEIARLAQSGMSLEELSERYGLTQKTLKSCILAWVSIVPRVLKKNDMTKEDV